MFCPKVSSVLLSDKFGNDMLCSILLLSLGFNVLTDYFYWGASSCQQTETLTPKGFFPKFLSEYIRYTECALWSIFSIQISPLSNNLCFRPFRLTLLYHGIRYRTSVLFIFVQFISHLQKKEKLLKWKTKFRFWTKCKSKFHIGRSYFCTHICHIVFDNHYSV